jgi:hypothetical protein
MSHPVDLVDRIVAGVLAQLEATTASATQPERTMPVAKGALEISDTVITAALLESRGIVAGPIVFGTKAIVTPSAVDFLAGRKIGWSRSASGSAFAPAKAVKWMTIVSRSTSAVEALEGLARQAGVRWLHELAGCHRDAAQRAVSALCRGECDGVIALTGKPEALACYANRTANVRAAAAATIERIKNVKRSVGANLFAIDPSEQSAFALRNLLREIVSEGKPAAPADWNE